MLAAKTSKKNVSQFKLLISPLHEWEVKLDREDRKESCKILKPLVQALSCLPVFSFCSTLRLSPKWFCSWAPVASLMVLPSWSLRPTSNHTAFDLHFLQPHPSDSHLADGIVCGFLCPAFHVMPSTWLPENWVRCPLTSNSIFQAPLPPKFLQANCDNFHPALLISSSRGLPTTTMQVYWRIASVSQADCTDLATMVLCISWPAAP